MSRSTERMDCACLRCSPGPSDLLPHPLCSAIPGSLNPWLHRLPHSSFVQLSPPCHKRSLKQNKTLTLSCWHGLWILKNLDLNPYSAISWLWKFLELSCTHSMEPHSPLCKMRIVIASALQNCWWIKWAWKASAPCLAFSQPQAHGCYYSVELLSLSAFSLLPWFGHMHTSRQAFLSLCWVSPLRPSWQELWSKCPLPLGPSLFLPHLFPHGCSLHQPLRFTPPPLLMYPWGSHRKGEPFITRVFCSLQNSF